jgi:hypothetical protein
MTSLPELEAAFVKADDAGNTEDAQAFATEIKRLRAVPPAEGQPMHATAGLANFAAGALGTPATILKGLVNAPGMIAGTAATAAGRPDLAPGTIDVPGGPEFYANLMRKTGVSALNPDNPDPKSKIGTLAYDMASRGGFIPGGVLPAAASIAAEKIGGPQWAGVGALAPSAATAAFNAARAPTLATQKAQNTVRDATLKDAQDAGYVLPPSAVKPTAVGNAVESFAGKSALKQEADLKNQQVTNRLAREELTVPEKGLHVPENAPITEGLLDKLRTQASEPYRQVAALSPVADRALQVLRDARSQAKDQWRNWDMQGVPEAKRQAIALDQKAEMLERLIERQATSAGKPELVQQLRESRTYIAKTFDIERALNLGNGNVDAQIIGRALDRGRPLTGNLETIAKFAEGPGRQFTREGSKVPAAGVSALNWPVAAALGVEGSHYMGPYGAALAAVPFARGGVRSGLLSDTYQQNFNRPSYEPAMRPQGTLEAILQQSILANQREQNQRGRP